MRFSKLTQYLLIILVVFMAGILVGQNYQFKRNGNNLKVNFVGSESAPKNVDTKIIWEAYDKLTQNFLFRDKLDPQKLIYGAAEGLVASAGDPYTAFFNPENNEKFNNQLAGTYEGVGLQLGYKERNLVVLTPIIDTPAYKAGMLAGDRIIGIDNRSTVGMTIPEAVSLIKGTDGSEVTLQVLRGSDRKDFKLKRQKIKIKSVELSQKDGIAIIKLNQFGSETQGEWDEAVAKVATNDLAQIPASYNLGTNTQEMGAKGGKVKGVILDMRGNPGGILEQAVHIASEFVDKSPIVYQEDATGNKKYYNIPEGRQGKLLNVPLVVLIDGGSASASEIVTGALMDYKRAKVVGEKSFGKGTVQGVVDLSDKSSIHVTISKWLTPNGTWVHEKGIQPDMEVKRTEEDVTSNRDPQLEAALKLF